jgi:hypothetical protein
VQDAPAEPIDGPDHENLEAASHRILEHLVECWALVAPLGAADAGVLVGLDDLPPPMPGDPGERHTLVLGRLAVCRTDPEVECRTGLSCSHSSPSELYHNDTTCAGFVELFVQSGCDTTWR